MFIRPIPRRGLFFPPGAIPRVNERHPAAGALRGAYLFTGRPLALRAGYGNLAVQTGAPVPAMGPVGVYQSYTAVSGHQGSSAPTGDTSIVLVAMRAITASGGGVSRVQVAASSYNPGTATPNGFEIDLGNSFVANLNNLAVGAYAAGVAIPGINAYVNGIKQTITSGIGSTTLTNGVWYGVGVTFPNLPATSDGPITFGNFPNSLFALTGGVAAAFVFSGVLPDQVMIDLTLNPSGLLVWPEDLAPTIARAPISYPFTPDPVGYEYSPADVALTYTPGSGVQIDTHDGIKKRSRRERRIEALRQRGEAERLADAQALRLALEAALGVAAEVAPAVAPRVVEAVQRAPKPAEVDWRRVAEDAEQYARLSRMVSRLSALVQDEARRLADEDDDDAAFLLGIA